MGGAHTADRRASRLLLPCAAGLAFFAATLLGIYLARLVDNVAAIWIPNGILLAVLLVRADRALSLFAAGTLASFAANIVTDHGLPASVILTAGNMAEVAFAAWLL